MNDNDTAIVKMFKKSAAMASYHYADDSGNEWCNARTYVNECVELYIQNKNLEKEMIESIKGLLCEVEILNRIENYE